MDKQQRKAKRRLSDISFEHEGAHVALTHELQGGPANEMTTLVTKATNDISEEEFEKAYKDKVDKQDDDNPCWEGYEQRGTKTQGGKQVPNCVPMSKSTTNKATQENEENTMTVENTQDLQTELEKAQAQVADLQKAKEDLEKAKEEKANLEKAFSEVNDTVKVLKAAEEKRKEAEYLEKAKQHTAVVNDDLPAEDFAKALRAVENVEGADAIVKALDAYKQLASSQGMFEEIGKSKTDDQPSGSALDVAIEKAQQEHSVGYLEAMDIVKKKQPELFAEEYKI